MKLTRLLSFIMLFFIAFTSVQVFAVEEVVPGGDDPLFYESENIISALGIFDSIDKESNISRAEFAAVAVRLVNSQLTGFTRYYADVNEDTAFAQEITQARVLGIATGTADQLFNPDVDVTYAQALKMVITALGYDAIAQIKGGYPQGYVSVARDNDIIDNIALGNDAPLDYKTAVILAANALRSDVLNVSAISSDSPDDITHYEKDVNEQVIHKYFALTLVDGVAWTAGIASMRKSEGNEGQIDIEGNVYNCNDADLQQYIGLNVIAGVSDNKKAEFVFASTENKIFEADASNVEFVDSHKAKIYDENNKERNLSFDIDYTALKNNVLSVSNPTASEDSSFKFIDNDSDGKIDVVNSIVPEYFVVSTVSKDTVIDRNGKSFAQTTGVKLGEDITYMGWGTSKKITPEEIRPNMVLAVYANDADEIIYINASYRVLQGAKVTQMDNHGNIWLDDVKYATNSYYKQYCTQLSLGQRITVYFDDYGRICFVDRYVSASSDGYVYGYFLARKEAEGMGNPFVKLLCADGEIRAFEMKDKIILDGVKVSSSGNEITNKFGQTYEPKYQLVRYMTDENGLLTKLDTATDREKTDDLVASYDTTSWETDNYLTRYVKAKRTIYRGSGDSFYPYGIKGTVVFEVPKALTSQQTGDFDETLFKVRSSGFSDSQRLTVDLYDFSSNFEAGAVVAYTTSGGGTTSVEPDGRNDVVLVESVSGVLTAEGDETVSINGVLCNTWGSSSRVNYKISPKLIDYFRDNNMLPKAGDILQLNIDSAGLVDGIRIERYDNTTGEFIIEQVGGYIMGDRGFLGTKALDATDKAFAFVPSIKGNELGDVDSPADGVYIMPNTYRCQIWVYDFEKETLTPGTAADILTIKNTDEYTASDLIVFLDNALPAVVVVYR